MNFVCENKCNLFICRRLFLRNRQIRYLRISFDASHFSLRIVRDCIVHSCVKMYPQNSTPRHDNYPAPFVPLLNLGGDSSRSLNGAELNITSSASSFRTGLLIFYLAIVNPSFQPSSTRSFRKSPYRLFTERYFETDPT